MDSKLPFMINDADNHFLEPADMYERYIDPKQRDKVVRLAIDEDGNRVELFAGRPSKLGFTRESVPQTQEEAGQLATIAASAATDENTPLPGDGGARTPGMFLNRLNPYKGLSEDERQMLAGLVERVRANLSRKEAVDA